MKREKKVVDNDTCYVVSGWKSYHKYIHKDSEQIMTRSETKLIKNLIGNLSAKFLQIMTSGAMELVKNLLKNLFPQIIFSDIGMMGLVKNPILNYTQNNLLLF